jgi:uncharacterized tellurite resistance protein B-like protein
MFKALQKFLDDHFVLEEPSLFGHQELRLAAAALLFEAARADFDLDSAEQDALYMLVREQFELEEQEAIQLLALAEKEAHNSSGLYDFTNLINQHWSIEERTRLIDNMWQVVYADGRLDDNEQHLMRKIQNLLHVPHLDYIAAKFRHKPS